MCLVEDIAGWSSITHGVISEIQQLCGSSYCTPRDINGNTRIGCYGDQKSSTKNKVEFH